MTEGASVIMTEREICDWMWKVAKEGRKARQDGSICPYAANTVAAVIHIEAWVIEDLRLALMKANPSYGEEQRRFEAAGVYGKEPSHV